MTIRVNRSMDEITSIPNEWNLDSQAVERLSRMDTGTAILCTCGILWVTQAGDLEDYMLQKGDVFVANRRGVVVIQALTKATYRLLSHNKMHDWVRLGWDAVPSSFDIEQDFKNLYFGLQSQRVLNDLTSNCK